MITINVCISSWVKCIHCHEEIPRYDEAMKAHLEECGPYTQLAEGERSCYDVHTREVPDGPENSR